MGQPTPPGDIPLYEGLSHEWNDVLSVIPEDKRAEVAPKILERTKIPEDYTRWEDLNKSGITPEQAGNALSLYQIIENNPRQVYDMIGKHLNITPQQAQQVVEEIQEADDDSDIFADPRVKAMKDQLDTMSQIMLAQNEQATKAAEEEKYNQELQKELDAVKKEFGSDVNEDQILMRMYTKGISAKDAHIQYMNEVSDILKRRPAPMVMGSGGYVPNKPLDPTKMNSQETRAIVAQMLQQGRNA